MEKVKRAVITGASSGIGEAFANLLASQGVNLIIAARRTDHLNQLAAKLSEKFKVVVDTLPLDLAEAGAAEKLFQFATQNGGTVDLLVNNAGAGPYRAFVKTSLLDHEKKSYILNVASVAAYQPVSRFAVYCASKSYVRIFSGILNYEMRGTNVSVSCLCPGGTKTEFLEKNNQNSKSGDCFLMDPEKVASIALKGMLKRKTVIIPGLFNKFACFFPMLLPDNINLTITERAMNLAVEEKV